ncbi:MAG: 16S rRNA (guanine(527)-N(7))-methyltransferase RsmG [Oceanospirillaceae bacterium]|nr:16S rRNA (guanine(527)-N(7))-methyltransferase RsmG [Oceanospirillaceae bacterium]|tara:strand:+ start:49 stop:690 length:642 start_codon:yes stop_codon:yes gene_type:complete
MNDLLQQLNKGAARLNITLTDGQQQALMSYLELLIKWNKAYNLTAIRDPQQMVALHLLDSLAVHPAVQGAQHIIDVGTGPGLPGVVLAIMNPHKQFTLLDSNGKKTRFLFQARTSLRLANVEIVNERCEAYHPPRPFDMIVSRAFASLADMVHWCEHMRAPHGCFLAMKGQFPEQELAELGGRYQLQNSEALEVPGVEGQRHLLTLVPAATGK